MHRPVAIRIIIVDCISWWVPFFRAMVRSQGEADMEG